MREYNFLGELSLTFFFWVNVCSLKVISQIKCCGILLSTTENIVNSYLSFVKTKT